LLVLYFAPFIVRHRYAHLQNRTDLPGATFTTFTSLFLVLVICHFHFPDPLKLDSSILLTVLETFGLK
jgi:hypothetical protein